jgi:hypothetical protein
MIFRLNEKAKDLYLWTMGYKHRKGLLLLQDKPGELFKEFLVDDPRYSLRGVAKRVLRVGP